jgi:hypothetical protein
VFTGGLHPTEAIDAFFIEFIRVVVEQRVTETADASERGTQVVGDRIAKRLQLLVYGPQLCCALLDALF